MAIVVPGLQVSDVALAFELDNASNRELQAVVLTNPARRQVIVTAEGPGGRTFTRTTTAASGRFALSGAQRMRLKPADAADFNVAFDAWRVNLAVEG